MGKLKIRYIYKQSNNNFLFFGKLIVLSIYASTVVTKLGYTELPLLSIFENDLNDTVSFNIWQFLFLLSSIFAFLNRKPKIFLFINGVLLVLALLMNELIYSNNLFFAGCLLITFSISSKSFNFVPIQLSILYFGAFIDKFYYEHWRNGDFMTAFFENNQLVENLKPFIDAHSLIMTMTYSTLIIEFLLAIFILIPKTRILFLILGLCFHFSTIFFMHSFFGIFIATILISYYSLVKTSINFNEDLSISKFINNIGSLFSSYKTKKDIWYKFELDNAIYKNYKAVILSMLLNPFTAIFLTLFFSLELYICFTMAVLFVLIIIIIILIFISNNKFRLPSKNHIDNG
jgi:hypothetical protein